MTIEVSSLYPRARVYVCVRVRWNIGERECACVCAYERANDCYVRHAVKKWEWRSHHHRSRSDNRFIRSGFQQTHTHTHTALPMWSDQRWVVIFNDILDFVQSFFLFSQARTLFGFCELRSKLNFLTIQILFLYYVFWILCFQPLHILKQHE